MGVHKKHMTNNPINPNSPLTFACGLIMKNRFMLAPLTNQQSHEDGQLSEEEFHWLSLRAKGQFGITMTCASHVQVAGKGFPGQLGIYDDKHSKGHQRLTKGDRSGFQNPTTIRAIRIFFAIGQTLKHLGHSDPVTTL